MDLSRRHLLGLTGGGRCDRGFRVPTLVISRLARRQHVAHQSGAEAAEWGELRQLGQRLGWGVMS